MGAQDGQVSSLLIPSDGFAQPTTAFGDRSLFVLQSARGTTEYIIAIRIMLRKERLVSNPSFEFDLASPVFTANYAKNIVATTKEI